MDPEFVASPVGTVTFLLTDVEGSSRLWEGDPAAASKALARRQEIIRQATERHAGTLPAEQGEGDSSVSAFARASDAGACAVDIQRTLEVEPWPTSAAIRVRIALHTGEAEPRRDGTYQGAALNRCARLRSLAYGGQILLSQSTYEVLVDSLANDLVLRDLGMCRLRDLARPEHVWQLSHPALPDAFPPLRSLDAVSNNLPVELTSFVGREGEIDRVTALLREHRLVTLTGAGGCGKTRLALQVAASLSESHPDGIWWVDLAPLADPSLVPAALAAVLGVRESPIEPITDTVIRFLQAHRSLVGLDNCEHLIESCAAFAMSLMQGCSGVTLLATSREPLRVVGETTWSVPSLSLPEAATVESLDRCEAARLFVDRARAAQPSFSITDDVAPAVAQVCARLDGIPLAIELAAARTRMLTVDQIAEGLADRFHLLTGGARTALPRQRTLESSVDWSHDLLDDRARAVFRRLAVFAGSFTIEAAESVCAGDGVTFDQVLDLLTDLVDRSLVHVAEATASQTRYRMLETIRDYARHKLTDAGEAEAIRDRHLDHYASFATRAATGLEGSDMLDWLARVDAEIDNVRAALDWGPHSTDPDRGLRLVGRLCLYWFARSELGVGRGRLQATLDSTVGDGPERADALSALCMVSYRASDMVSAARHGDEAVAVARRLDDASLLGRALHFRAWVRYWGEADRFAAWAELEEAATLLRQAGDRTYAPLNAGVFAWTCIDTSALPRARDLLDESAVRNAPDVSPGRCYYRIALGYLGLQEGRFADAAAHLEQALDLAQRIGDHYAEICARLFVTYVDVFRGRNQEARACCERGLATALAHRSPNGEAFMRLSLGFVELAERHLSAAAVELQASFEILGVAMPLVGAHCRFFQAQVALAQGSPLEAREHAAEAVRLGRQLDIWMPIAYALIVQAALARDEGDPHLAEDLLHDALDIVHRLGARPVLGDLLDALGGSLADQDRHEEGARLLGAAQALRDSIGTVRVFMPEGDYEADVAAVRDAIGPGAFDRAWADGSGLSLDEAVAYARRGRGARKRPSHGWPSLTPTEAQVVELVAQGLTNPQIGERLFISKRTVQTHLAHVFTKLGVSTRSELAAATAQQQAALPPA